MADPKIPDPSSSYGIDALERGSRTVKQYAADLKKLVDQWQHYVKQIGQVNKLTDAQVKQYNRVRKAYIDANKEQTAFGKSVTALVSKLEGSGGVTAAITRFAGVVPGLSSSVNEATGMMKIFGATTKISAGAFSAYVAAAQLAIGVVIKFLDVQDKARIKQAGFMRSFGALNNISITAPYAAAAKGIEIAGETGEEAAKNLFNTIAQMRAAGKGEMPLGPEAKTLGAGGVSATGEQFGRLTTWTAGVLPTLPKYLMQLRDVFAMKPGKGMADELEKIMTVAYESNVPIEQFVSEIFALGEAFVGVGMTTKEATDLMGRFGDAIGNAELPMQMVIDFARQTTAELRTAGGVTGLFTAAHFATQGFTELDPEVRSLLNRTAQDIHQGKDFRDLSMGQKAAVFEKMGEGGYGVARRDIFYKLIRSIESEAGGALGMGGQIAKKLSLILTGQEWRGLQRIATADMGGAATNYTELEHAYQDALLSGDRDTIYQTKRALEEAGIGFKDFAVTVAGMNKTFMDPFTKAYEEFAGAFIDLTKALTGRTKQTYRLLAEFKSSEALLRVIASHPQFGTMTSEQRLKVIESTEAGRYALELAPAIALYTDQIRAKNAGIAGIPGMGWMAPSVTPVGDMESMPAWLQDRSLRIPIGSGGYIEIVGRFVSDVKGNTVYTGGNAPRGNE